MPHLIALLKYWVFYKLKVCGNLALSKSIDATFQITFAHFMSLCHILAILPGFQTFSLLWYFLWRSVIFDVTIVFVLRCHKPHPYKTLNLIIEMTTKDLEHYISLADKAVAGFDRIDSNFERHSTVDKMLLSSISWYRKIICSKPTSLLFSQIATTTPIFSKHHHDQSAAVDTLQWHT